MLSLTVVSVKQMTSLIFAKDALDPFLLKTAVIRRGFRAEFDGQTTDGTVLWKEIRPAVLELLKGEKRPEYFKLVFLTAPEATEKLVEKSGFTDCPVTSFSLNFTYQNESLSLTTGVAYEGFTLSKEAEKAWDNAVLRFLEKNAVPVRETDI